jgi:pyridoxamine 5'-phosphate oxidase
MTGDVDPVALALSWLPGPGDPERPQVQLATVDADGAPDARTVLLTAADEGGFAFHTDARSRKAAHIRAEPRVALVVLWPGFTRQLVIRGVAVPQDPDAARTAYAARSPYLQQLAWQNTAELAALPRAERVARWARFPADDPEASGSDGPQPPPTWAGFLVRPTRLTFWESDAETASRRREFRRASVDAAEWREEHLPG